MAARVKSRGSGPPAGTVTVVSQHRVTTAGQARSLSNERETVRVRTGECEFILRPYACVEAWQASVRVLRRIFRLRHKETATVATSSLRLRHAPFHPAGQLFAEHPQLLLSAGRTLQLHQHVRAHEGSRQFNEPVAPALDRAAAQAMTHGQILQANLASHAAQVCAKFFQSEP